MGTSRARYSLVEYVWESQRTAGRGTAIVQTTDHIEAAALIAAGLPEPIRLRQLGQLKPIGDRGTMVFGRELLRENRVAVGPGGQVW